jgi:hypothetical protein
VTSVELLHGREEIYGDSRFDDVRYQLVNGLEMTSIDFNINFVKKMVALDAAASLSNPRVKIALVFQQLEDVQAINTEYGKLVGRSKWQVASFGSLTDAREWIGIPGDNL